MAAAAATNINKPSGLNSSLWSKAPLTAVKPSLVSTKYTNREQAEKENTNISGTKASIYSSTLAKSNAPPQKEKDASISYSKTSTYSSTSVKSNAPPWKEKAPIFSDDSDSDYEVIPRQITRRPPIRPDSNSQITGATTTTRQDGKVTRTAKPLISKKKGQFELSDDSDFEEAFQSKKPEFIKRVPLATKSLNQTTKNLIAAPNRKDIVSTIKDTWINEDKPGLAQTENCWASSIHPTQNNYTHVWRDVANPRDLKTTIGHGLPKSTSSRSSNEYVQPSLSVVKLPPVRRHLEDNADLSDDSEPDEETYSFTGSKYHENTPIKPDVYHHRSGSSTTAAITHTSNPTKNTSPLQSKSPIRTQFSRMDSQPSTSENHSQRPKDLGTTCRRSMRLQQRERIHIPQPFPAVYKDCPNTSTGWSNSDEASDVETRLQPIVTARRKPAARLIATTQPSTPITVSTTRRISTAREQPPIPTDRRNTFNTTLLSCPDEGDEKERRKEKAAIEATVRRTSLRTAAKKAPVYTTTTARKTRTKPKIAMAMTEMEPATAARKTAVTMTRERPLRLQPKDACSPGATSSTPVERHRTTLPLGKQLPLKDIETMNCPQRPGRRRWGDFGQKINDFDCHSTNIVSDKPGSSYLDAGPSISHTTNDIASNWQPTSVTTPVRRKANDLSSSSRSPFSKGDRRLVHPSPMCVISPRKETRGTLLHHPPVTPRHRSVLAVTATPQQVLLAECGQDKPVSMAAFLGMNNIKQAIKIGEGSYAEVYSCPFEGENVAVKIMPFGGPRAEDGDWKRVEDVLQEVVMTTVLSDARTFAPNFIEVKRVGICHGPFNNTLLRRWDDYEEEIGSENDRPDSFEVCQLFVVFVFSNGGKDVEHAVLENFKQGQSILRQLVVALASAEEWLNFEHRDLHWGNVLVGPTRQSMLKYVVEGCPYVVPTNGVHVNIIDNTLSRLDHDGQLLFYDLSNEDIFEGVGDSQFEVYREMRVLNKNDWHTFNPKTNVMWVCYMANKLVCEKKYPREKGIVMKIEKQRVKAFIKRAQSYSSAIDMLKDEYLDLV